MIKININVPRLNANDDDVEVIDIYINNGEQIKKGQKLFTFETTKTAIDFNSEYNGIINRISIKKGEFVKVGDLIGIVTTDKKILDQKKTKEVKFKNRSLNNSKKKITAKALKLLKENNLDLDEIESFNDKITTENIINYLNKKKIKVNISKKSFIIGCGGHALTVADIVLDNNWDLRGFCAKNENELGNKILNSYKVIACNKDILNLKKKNILTCFIGIGGTISNNSRKDIFESLYKKDFILPTLISKKSYISRSSFIGTGTVIFPGAIIGPNVRIGKNCIINYNSIVCHDSIIENHVHLTPNSVIAGNCFIGESSTIGMCSTILNSTKIGKNCLTHNNTSISTDLKDDCEINRKGKIFNRKKR